jgi:hypothetical protein
MASVGVGLKHPLDRPRVAVRAVRETVRPRAKRSPPHLPHRASQRPASRRSWGTEPSSSPTRDVVRRSAVWARPVDMQLPSMKSRSTSRRPRQRRCSAGRTGGCALRAHPVAQTRIGRRLCCPAAVGICPIELPTTRSESGSTGSFRTGRSPRALSRVYETRREREAIRERAKWMFRSPRDPLERGRPSARPGCGMRPGRSRSQDCATLPQAAGGSRSRTRSQPRRDRRSGRPSSSLWSPASGRRSPRKGDRPSPLSSSGPSHPHSRPTSALLILHPAGNENSPLPASCRERAIYEHGPGPI